MADCSVLLLGYRPAIAERLHARNINFALWHDRPIKRKTIPGCIRRIENTQYATRKPKIREQLAELFPEGTHFDHVIAGTEASVVVASVARRAFGARKTKDTVVLRCHDKRYMKEYLRDRDIPLIPFHYGGEGLSASKLIQHLGLPMVAKEVDNSGGRGMEILRTPEDVEANHTRKVLFESYVQAPEMSVEAFVQDGDILFENPTQYVENGGMNLVPSGHPEQLNQKVLELNRRVIAALGIKWGLCHAEYYLTEKEILFGEIALRPPGGYIVELITLAYGFDAWDAFVENELAKDPQFKEAEQWAMSALFHPGAGKLVKLEGQEELQQDPNLIKLKLLTKPGETISPRRGVSEVAAYALFQSRSKSSILKSARAARKKLIFHLENK